MVCKCPLKRRKGYGRWLLPQFVCSEATGKLRLGCILPLSTNNISGAVVKGLGQGILSGHYKTNVSPRYYSRNAVHWQHKNYQTPLRLLSLFSA